MIVAYSKIVFRDTRESDERDWSLGKRFVFTKVIVVGPST